MSPIQYYLDTVAQQLAAGNATEHTYRPTLKHLLNALLPDLRVTNEPRRLECNSPDFEVANGVVPIGYIEAKTIGVDLDKTQNSEQLQRYFKALDNVILTDYLEFRWYVKDLETNSYHAKIIVCLADVEDKGKLKSYPERFAEFENLLKNFIEAQSITLRSPEDLAEKMAYIATQMKTSILEGYQNENKFGKLHGQLDSFRSVLIDTLKVEEFADMLAQTVCYGLFAAKCSSVGQPFSRLTAIFFVPKTNPLLRDLFNQLAGVDLDDGLVWLVEHLVKVLNHSDIGAILADFGKRTRQEDPVVHFYETFLKHYNPQVREIRGVYYTPEPVVSYIVRSVDLLLKDNFKLKKGLADATKLEDGLHKVQILDPATGTGTFLYAVIAHIRQQITQKVAGNWSNYVSENLLPRIHGFELLMAAYTVAHMKLGLQLQEQGYDFKKDERLRVFLTNTLDKAHEMHEPQMAKFLSDEANAANTVKRDTPVMVILGNPPYSYASANANKDAKGEFTFIGDLIRDYYQVDGESLHEHNPKGLQDDYVKFIRFAQWRIHQTGHGILGFVTNHGYLDNPTFRGMRQALMQEFDEIYLVDLHGNSKKKEKHPDGSNDKNVFDIQQGVAIGIFVKHQNKKAIVPTLQRGNSSDNALALRDAGASEAAFPRQSVGTIKLAKVYHAHLYGERKTKYQWLEEKDIKNTDWTELKPQSPFYLFIPQNTDLLPEYDKYWQITEVMPINSTGVKTHRDHFVFDFDFEKKLLHKRISDFRNLELSDEKISELYNLKNTRDWKLTERRKNLSFNTDWEKYFTKCLYRPFDLQHYYHHKDVVELPKDEVMQHFINKDNLGLVFMRQVALQNTYSHFLATNSAVDNRCFYSNKGTMSLAPLYIYPKIKNDLVSDNTQQETARQANFSYYFIVTLEEKLDLKFIVEEKGDFENTISALDVFHYMYAVFHSPTYRERYADFLKIDFPRLPITSDKNLFKKLSVLGEQLVKIHLMNAEIDNDSTYPIDGNGIVEKVEYKDNKVYINKTQYFDNVTPEVWEFHIGGYQVCQKWLKDRKDRKLSTDDLFNYLYILAALEKTQDLMAQIDEAIPSFPIL